MSTCYLAEGRGLYSWWRIIPEAQGGEGADIPGSLPDFYHSLSLPILIHFCSVALVVLLFNC